LNSIADTAARTAVSRSETKRFSQQDGRLSYRFLGGDDVGLINEDVVDRRSPRSTDLFHPQSAAFFQMSFWTLADRQWSDGPLCADCVEKLGVEPDRDR
jgi:hypothetical protein